MPIVESEMDRDFIVVEERATVRQVRDRVAETGMSGPMSSFGSPTVDTLSCA